MAITVTINSVDFTAYIPMVSGDNFTQGLQISQEATFGNIATATFDVVDEANALSISEKQEVVIADGATTLFGGYVAEVQKWELGPGRRFRVACQDYNIILRERLVDDLSNVTPMDDDTFIGVMFGLYASEIDSATYVDMIANIEFVRLQTMTLHEAMVKICQISGGRFYVDFDKNLHYFSEESVSAAFNLSDNPNFSTTYPYNDFRIVEDATTVVDRVLIKCTDDEAGEINFLTWYGAGTHDALLELNDATQSVAEAQAQGLIDRYSAARKQYSLICRQDGLTAGEDIQITNGRWGLSAETLTIRRITMTCLSADGAERQYVLELGDQLNDSIVDSGGGTGFGGGGGVSRHALLCSYSHTDTIEAAPTRGDIVTGQNDAGIIQWGALSAETAGFILVGDGTDINSQAFDWDVLAAGAGADMVHNHTSNAEGGVLNLDDLGNTSLADPNADRIVFWDDGDNQFEWLTPNSHLSITGNNLNVTPGTIGLDDLASTALADPGADRIVFWDDSDNQFEWLVANSHLSITGNNLDVTPGTIGLDDLASTALSDPGADRIVFWDDSDNQFEWLTPETGLAISGNTFYCYALRQSDNGGAALTADADGHLTAAGNLTVNGNIVVTGTVDGVDVSAHNARHERAGADEINGDHLDIDWNPSNYTPATTPSEASSVDDLTAHLYGIDQALADPDVISQQHVTLIAGVASLGGTSYLDAGGDFYYDTATYATGSATWRVTLKTDSSATAYAELYDLTAASQLAEVSTASTSYVHLSAAVTLTNGHWYRVRLKSSGGATYAHCLGCYIKW